MIPIPRLKEVWRQGFLGACLMLPVSGISQTVIAVPNIGTAIEPLARAGLGGPKTKSLSDLSSAFPSLAAPATWGPVQVRPHFAYSIIYGDGILRVPGEPTNTTVQDFFAGVLFELGKHFSLDFTEGRTWNSSRLLADYSTRNIILSGTVAKGDWTFGASENYSSTAHTLVETGRQTPQISYATSVYVSYQLGTRSLLDLDITRNIRKSDLPETGTDVAVEDLRQWSGTASFHYRVSAKLDAAVGMNFGYDKIANSSNMSTSQPQLTINWRATRKLSLMAQGGIETRRFRRGNTEDLSTEVYNASATYQPTLYTTLAISGNKGVSPSYYANQVTKSNGWAASLRQRVFERFYLSAGFSHGATTYLLTDRGFQEGRDDSFDSFTAAISTTFFTRGSISLSYTKSRNVTNVNQFEFSSQQVGMQIAYRY